MIAPFMHMMLCWETQENCCKQGISIVQRHAFHHQLCSGFAGCCCFASGICRTCLRKEDSGTSSLTHQALKGIAMGYAIGDTLAMCKTLLGSCSFAPYCNRPPQNTSSFCSHDIQPWETGKSMNNDWLPSGWFWSSLGLGLLGLIFIHRICTAMGHMAWGLGWSQKPVLRTPGQVGPSWDAWNCSSDFTVLLLELLLAYPEAASNCLLTCIACSHAG